MEMERGGFTWLGSSLNKGAPHTHLPWYVFARGVRLASQGLQGTWMQALSQRG